LGREREKREKRKGMERGRGTQRGKDGEERRKGKRGKRESTASPTKILDPPLSLSIIGCSKSAHINEVC